MAVAVVVVVLVRRPTHNDVPVIEPPAPESWEQLRAPVRAYIAKRRDGVGASQRSAQAWTELGLAYEANRLIDLFSVMGEWTWPASISTVRPNRSKS